MICRQCFSSRKVVFSFSRENEKTQFARRSNMVFAAEVQSRFVNKTQQGGFGYREAFIM